MQSPLTVFFPHWLSEVVILVTILQSMCRLLNDTLTKQSCYKKYHHVIQTNISWYASSTHETNYKQWSLLTTGSSHTVTEHEKRENWTKCMLYCGQLLENFWCYLHIKHASVSSPWNGTELRHLHLWFTNSTTYNMKQQWILWTTTFTTALCWGSQPTLDLFNHAAWFHISKNINFHYHRQSA
jgi:hypothetical protein